jgi:PAS domain-containing protein
VWIREAAAAPEPATAPEAELRLRRRIENQSLALDRFSAAIAVFGGDRRLEAYNAAFAKLWALPGEWLDGHPTHEAVLDRLRETRKLPERRDYQVWKREQRALFGGRNAEERWVLPDGRTLRVSFSNNQAGGASILFEDVTERLDLESSLKLQLTAQAATLDALGEAVAAFGPDGRLALSNAAFASMWEIERAALAARPHIREIAAQCLAAFGDEAMWDRLVAVVTSGPAQRRDWRKIHRSDGRVFSLTTMPLPDRATLVTFMDVSDRFGREKATRERNQALETLERLRADYIRQLSHELRTPLNAVSGFAQQLAASGDEAMTGVSREQVKAILSGAEDLTSVVDGMLETLADERATCQMGEPPREEERRRQHA